MDRLHRLTAWLGSCLPGRALRLEPASADASFRRYFRAIADDASWIVMDAPTGHEDCRPFVRVAGLLQDAGLHAPKVLAQDLEQGFLLLTDLGKTTYLTALEQDRQRATALFGDATSALVQWQLATREGVLPDYDEPLLRRELALFPDWYVARHRGRTLTPEESATLAHTFDLIVASNLAQSRVYVHRDFMPRNLMLTDPNPGILDFQDAVLGPITYDVASLFRDAFISWEEAEVLDGTIRYWESARRAGLPVNPDFGQFWREVEWMGLQRHLKVLGIFARLHYRDGKPGYLADTARFVGYVRATAQRYQALFPLARLLDVIEDHRPGTGYTF